jgi:hypothetical protein
MSIKEKVAYLQGLADGMNVDKMEGGKLFSTIIDTLSEMADEIDALAENALDIGEEIDALSDDLADVEMLLEDMDIDDEDYDFDYNDFFDDDDYDDDDDYEDDDDYDESDDFDEPDCGSCRKAKFSIDVNCPECNAAIELDEEDIANEAVTCPGCAKQIELEIDEVDVDDEVDNIEN